jgi:hypothetical protein
MFMFCTDSSGAFDGDDFLLGAVDSARPALRLAVAGGFALDFVGHAFQPVGEAAQCLRYLRRALSQVAQRRRLSPQERGMGVGVHDNRKTAMPRFSFAYIILDKIAGYFLLTVT